MILPRCGVLLTYGRAEVISIFRFPGSGRIGCVEPMAWDIFRAAEGGMRDEI